MRFAGFPKFSLLTLLAGVFALTMAGCGGSSNMALTQGNWAVTAVSGGKAGTFLIGGNLTQSGSNLTGTMYISQSLCFDSSQAVNFTGTVKGKNVTLTSASVAGQVVTVTASGTTGAALSGTYSVAGGCAGGDSGTIAGNAVPSISGTWNGAVVGSGGANVTVSVHLTQAATASANGTFALSGSLAYTGSSCSVSGTISAGSLAGTFISSINANTVETDSSQGAFSYTNVVLDSTTAPKNMSGTYDVVVGLCSPDNQTLTLTKQ